MVLQGHVTNNHHISITRVSIATNLRRMIASLDGLLPMMSHDPLITWPCEIWGSLTGGGSACKRLSHHWLLVPSVLKTTKVVPVYEKDSKLDFSRYRPISLLSNIEKILEKLMHKRFYTFPNNNNIIYNLQFGFRLQYSSSHALKVTSATKLFFVIK